MALLGSKWLIAVLVILALLVILYFVGRKSVHAEVVIEASPEEVWSVLTDIPKIKDWNTVLIPIEGELTEGATLTYEFYQDEGGDAAVMGGKVKRIIEHQLINQAGGMQGVLTFDHQYILTELDEQTKVTIHEEYRGIMVPFWNPKPVGEAYERLLASLQERVMDLKNRE